MEHIIDAKGKKLGRVATEAASLLMGKNTTSFVRNSNPEVTVKVINASQADISAKKMEEHEYKNFSGYPGGLKETPMKQIISKKGFAEVFRIAIEGMLPKNRLQAKMLKNLVIVE